MNARNLGFATSWRMLTSEKGWIKPMLVLTLVSWIPILGQIVLLGYGMEWARLTAWGVDSAPKQRNIDYGKVLSTGGRAFLVNLSLGIVIALVLQILFPGSLVWLASGLVGIDGSALTLAASGVTASLIMLIASIFVDTFLRAACMRATIYDDFAAGWRLDRLAQMVGRDFGGFFKAWLVTAIGAVISSVYAAIVAFLGMLVAVGGAFGASAYASMYGHLSEEMLLRELLNWGAGPVLLLFVLALALLFIGNVISVTMSMVSMNAMGQWFCRFDVNRWGLSGDPLPADVPHRDAAQPVGGGMPASPVDPAASAQAAQPAPTPEPMAPVTSVAPAAPAEPVEPIAPATTVLPVEPVTPLDAPEPADSAEQVELPATEEALEPVVDEEIAREVAEQAARSVAEEGALSEQATAVAEPAAERDAEPDEPEATKKPIPLGPISTDGADSEEDGPISV